ncbi:hypothetical protein L3K57_15790 (plasmid) [Enterococcus faecium]|nr:hypothetical protein [Enterococcus faecium]UJV65266.1 hypothetical protein L3K57_15790 [Enterococcus faecium]
MNNISISQYIATVIDELISGKYDYAFDFEGEKVTKVLLSFNLILRN